jgi:hypothetical protein
LAEEAEEFLVASQSSLEEFFLAEIKPKIDTHAFHPTNRIQQLNLRLREFFGLFLLSAFLSDREGRPFRPAVRVKNIGAKPGTRMPYDDGALCDVENNFSIEVEHTYVYHWDWDGKVTEGIRAAIKSKSSKTYPKNAWLVIHADANGDFNPDWIKEAVKNSPFHSIFLYAKNGQKSEYSYYVQILKQFRLTSNSLYEMDINPENGKITVVHVTEDTYVPYQK